MKKQISSSIILLMIACLVYSCQGKKAEPAAADSTMSATPAPTAEASHAEGKKIFDTYCILCHGADGKLGLNGSKDLTISILTMEERIAQVTNGKGTMTPFKDILTEAEIKAVAGYTETLKK